MTSSRLKTSPRVRRARIIGRVFAGICRACAWGSLLVLGIMLVAITRQAWSWLDWQFLTSVSSRKPEATGVLAALVGSLWLIAMTAMISVPIGVASAVYLEEYASPTRLTRFIRLNISNLAGVPSIVYGILGFSVFVRFFGVFETPITWSMGDVEIRLPFGPCLLSAALTLSLLSLPVIIIATQEALRSVPQSIRHASLALGATRWQTIRWQVLPAAVPGIVTGTILAMSRAVGETAPLAVLGIPFYYSKLPGSMTGWSDLWQNPSTVLQAPFGQFTAVPLQIYDWVSRPQDDFRYGVAAAGILVLLVVLLTFNAIAIAIREVYQQKIRW